MNRNAIEETIDRAYIQLAASDAGLDIAAFHTLLATIITAIEKDFGNFCKSDLACERVTKIATLSNHFISAIHEAEPGYATIQQEIDYLNELLHDRSIRQALADDPEMDDIVKATIKAIKL